MNNTHTTSPVDPAWPRPLRGLPEGDRARPAQLYVRGALPGDRPAVAVIGTREIDALMVARIRLIVAMQAELDAESSVLSGLALGCDAEAHRQALSAGLHTTAVLPVGLDHITPGQHRPLAEQIVDQGGCLVTTEPPRTPVTGRAYVARDWVQSGAADALILCATGPQGGSWHATREAARLGRPLAWVAAPDEGGAKWDGNRLLSAALKDARAGRPEALGKLLHSREPQLHLRCSELAGKRTTQQWLERVLRGARG